MYFCPWWACGSVRFYYWRSLHTQHRLFIHVAAHNLGCYSDSEEYSLWFRKRYRERHNPDYVLIPFEERIHSDGKTSLSFRHPVASILGNLNLRLFLLFPDIILANPGTVFLTYAAQLSPVLLAAGLLLILALRLKRGVLALITGLGLCIVLFVIFDAIVNSIAYTTGSDWSLKIYAVITPNLVLQEYYLGTILGFTHKIWVPSFSEVLLYLLAGYILVAVVFIIGYVYFKRGLRI